MKVLFAGDVVYTVYCKGGHILQYTAKDAVELSDGSIGIKCPICGQEMNEDFLDKHSQWVRQDPLET